MKFVLSIFLILFIFTSTVYSQRPGAGGEFPKITIVGQVLDGESKTPLEFATISISSLKDNTILTGGLTDAEGKFEFACRPGKLRATIEFLSYESVEINPLPFKRGETKVDLGIIDLNVSGQVIEGVEIRAEKSETIFKLDKKIFTVGKDLANKGGSAEEVLDNVPSLTVDIDGNVNLRGSANVKMLINGQPSSLLRAGNLNGLKSIQASSIDRIEVITNPSAKYEAEGMAGIINIILKKEEQKGFNGSFDLGIGYPLQYNAGAQINFRKDKINFFVNLSSGLRVNPGFSTEYSRQRIDDAFRRSYKDADRDRRGQNNRVRAGIDYFIDKKQTLTFAGSFGISDDINVNTTNYLDSLEVNNQVNFLRDLVRIDNEKEDERNQEYSLKYVNSFGGRDQELSAFISYDESTEVEHSDIIQSINGVTSEKFQNVDVNEVQSNKLAQIDYFKKLDKDFKIEAGLRTNLRIIGNNYSVNFQDQNEITVIDSLTDDFTYRENIYAGYGTLSKSWGKKFSAQLGLRAEQTTISNEFKQQTSSDTSYQYFKVFPSAFFTYNINLKNAIQVSYSKRIQRPRFWYLNPFLTLSDDRNRFMGNPNLLPEYTDSYELGYIRYFDKGTLSSNLFFKQTDDVITRVRTINQDGTTVSFPINLNKEVSYGLDLSSNYDLTKKIKLDGNITFFNYNQSSDSFEEGISVSDVSWFGRVGTRVKFWENANLQLRFNYRAPRETIQGTRRAIYTVDLGLSKDFLNNNLTVTLSSRDLLNSRKRSYIFDLPPDYFAEGESQWRAGNVMLNLSYRINQKKQRKGNGQRSQGGFGGDEF